MKIGKGQIFNLMDTNGRRSDVINALQGYLTILDDILYDKKMIWDSMPNSLAQYEFYKQAIELSPDVFQKHNPYDNVIASLSVHKDFEAAVNDYDIEWIQENYLSYQNLISKFDCGIEDRARHYTSNLVKLGFADDNRAISPTGRLLLDLNKLHKDDLEIMLPINGVNVVYLRQLMKLRLFDDTGRKYYAPFNLAIFALLERGRMSENEFLELIQGLNPYFDFSNIKQFVIEYKAGNIGNLFVDGNNIPDELKSNYKVEEAIFREYFKNRKSTSAVNVYWEYYNYLFDFSDNPSLSTLDKLLTFYENNKPMLCKAFGYGQKIFIYESACRPSIATFLKENKDLFSGILNRNLYIAYSVSKVIDQMAEYSDTTRRIFKASGIISFSNGYVELAYKELCSCIFDKTVILSLISGDICDDIHANNMEAYENGINSFYCQVTPLTEILGYKVQSVKQIEKNIQKEFTDAPIADIPRIVADRRRIEFAAFIEENYPVEKVKELLGKFSDRRNDKDIKTVVSPDATVPTIYEYIVGLAWYYFSCKSIDILNSYNLTLSANFEPLVHAGGGQGDIVIYEKDKVVMLEATLMNISNQKRGEWEPVLRHSINLKVEEELANSGREVTSFFIADNFDCNTINIWKAIAAVPLQSSVNRNVFTDNVVIMPVNTEELAALMDKPEEYNNIISKVHDLFEVDKVNFDLDWRSKFMGRLTSSHL